MVLILILLAYLIYGLGFLIRTEAHLGIIRDNPGVLATSEGLETLRSMREDYQVIAPIVQNPLFPLEPLATYGKALRIGYDMLSRMGELTAFEAGIMEWKNTSETMSVFPLVDEVFSWLGSLDSDVQKLHTMVQ